jgi:hypothetical protein
LSFEPPRLRSPPRSILLEERENPLNHAHSLPGARDWRLKRLAEHIRSLAEKDENALRHARRIADMRRSAAAELHAVCAGLAASLNALLPEALVSLDPSVFLPEAFQEDSPNLFQINIRGRILLIRFEGSPELVSTEEFRIPYTLIGSIRAFKQEWLEQDIIEEQLVFYTVEEAHSMWRFFDARTYRSGILDVDYLIALLEQLL